MKQKKNATHNLKKASYIPYEVAFFSFMVFELLVIVYKNSDAWSTTQYLLNYKFGFSSRFLIGSILSLFTDRVTYKIIFITVIVFLLILIFLIAILLGAVIRACKPDEQSAVTMFAVLFLTSPLSITYLFGIYFAKFDLYWIILTLIAIPLLKNSVTCWLVPFICAAAVLVHQGYMVTYMPAIAIILLIEVYRSNYSKRSVALFWTSCLTMAGLFVVLQLMPKSISFENAVSFADYLANKADFTPSKEMIWLEYFAEFPDYWLNLHLPLIKSIALPMGCVMLTFSSFLIVIFVYVWKNSFLSTEKKFIRFIFVLCLMAPLMFTVAALFGTDWDRWWAAAVNNQFIIVFYFISVREKVVIDTVKKAGAFFDRHFLLFLLIIIFSNSLVFSGTASLLFSLLLSDDSPGFHLMWDYFNKNINGVIASQSGLFY